MKDLDNMANEATDTLKTTSLEEDTKVDTVESTPDLTETQLLRADLEAVTERVKKLEASSKICTLETFNQFVKTYVEPNKNVWIGAVVGLLFRFL